MQFFKDDPKKGRVIKREKVNHLEREFNGDRIEDGCDWLDGDHSLSAPRLLTEDDTKYIMPCNNAFKATLYPPQATLLHAMIELENNQKINIKDEITNNLFIENGTLHTRIGRLSEKFSFGKTVLALALICAQKYPLEKVLFNNFQIDSPAASIPEINIHYHTIVPITVVAAAASIISQWEQNIQKLTNLKYFIIDNVFSLKKFEKLVNENVGGTIGKSIAIDVVLIKVGRVTTSFLSKSEILKNNKNEITKPNRSLFEAFNAVINNAKIARFIIDDFDVLKLNSDDFLIPASFTWLISATRRQTSVKKSVSEADTVFEFLQKNIFSPVLTYAHDNILNKTLSIHCDPTYVDLFIQSTKILFKKILVKGGNATKLLQTLDVPIEVLEMINGDAVATAAQTLGLEVNTISGLLRAIIGQHIGALKNAIRTINRVNKLYNTNLPKYATTTTTATTTATTNELKTLIKEATDEELDKICQNAEQTLSITESNQILKSLKDAAEIAKSKALYPLNRLKDNIREGYCQCCSLPFKEEKEEEEENEENKNNNENNKKSTISASAGQDRHENNEKSTISASAGQDRNENNEKSTISASAGQDRHENNEKSTISASAGQDRPGQDRHAYILSNCCQIVICEDCITKQVSGKKQFIKRCPNCAQDIHLQGKGLIKVGDEINLEEALDDELDEKSINEISTTELDENSINEFPKVKALINFIKNETIDCISSEYIDPFITGLLIGSRDVQSLTGYTKKILIFSMMSETTQLLNTELTKFGIKNLILQGNRNQKDDIIKQFSNNVANANTNNVTINILLVTSAKDCAGLHLPFVTHIVFYHKVIDKNIEAQVAARGQRLGRTCNLEIISLLNSAENK